jgi:hypothetical protein
MCDELIVIPLAFSSGALSISPYPLNLVPVLASLSTLVMAAVSDVFPWSTWPMVPMFKWGFVRT